MSHYEQLTLGALVLALVLYHLITKRRARARREAMLQEYARSQPNMDQAVCHNLRAGDWPEDRIRLWCDASRCVYYPPEYNSTDF